ncbi:MAG: glycosyltransferase family 4 protein [Acidimicrobiales bacterium]|nr:glycosyltransferase family 4 protein [Acidimicrobiales bacterium]MBO0886362.1 glycosyltransferase family 4 protein [Acidimicrobiales bacterium]
MRVLLAVEQLRRAVPGGIGTYGRGLLQGLAGLDGTRPEVALLASRSPAHPDPLAGFGFPVVASSLPGPLLTRAWQAGLAGPPEGYQVVHAISLAAPPARRAAEVITVHDLAWRRLPETFPRRGRHWHEGALRRAIGGRARFVVPSAATASDLEEAGAAAERVSVVEEGCDHLPPPDRSAAASLLARIGVVGPYLLSVGTLEPRKNLSGLLAAYTLARPRLPEPWPLVVVGPAGWGPTLAASEGVHLAGPAGEGLLSGLYAGARCLAYVPLLEGFGLPPAEAMARGTPVVASPVPSTGGAALEVDPRDTEAIADGLVRAATDEPLRERLSAAGQARAAELTWARAARAHLEVWARAAGP